MNWIFGGIGTALIIFLLGLGTREAVRSRRTKQRQKAGDGSVQIQSGRDTDLGQK